MSGAGRLQGKVAIIHGAAGQIGSAVASAAAFLASDQAASIRGAVANLTCGMDVD